MADDWSRRALLASLPAIAAGCVGSPGPSEPDERTGSPTGAASDSTDVSPSPGRTVSPTPSTDPSPDPPTDSSTDPATSTTGRTDAPPDEVERLPADDPALAWAVRVPGPVSNPPTVDPSGDRVYVGTGTQGDGTPVPGRGDDDGAVFALDAADGRVAWRSPTPAPVTRRPVIHDGRIHVVSGYTNGYTGDDQRIVAFDPDGTRRWATQPRDGYVSIVGATDGSVLAGTADDQMSVSGQSLFAVGPDGDVRWERKAGDAMGGTIRDGRLLYNAGFAALAAYDPADGSNAWQVDGEPVGTHSSRVAAFDGRCFTESPDESDDGYALVAHSTADGSERWRYATAPASGENFVPTGVANVPQSIDAANDDEPLVGTEYGGTVFALRDDGSEQWTFAADDDTRDGPVVGDAVYVGDDAGTVYSLAPSDGSENWRASLPGRPDLRPLSNGVLASAGRERQRTVASIDAGGTVRWRYTTGKELHDPDVAGDRAYVTTTDGTVLAFAVGEGG